MPPPFTPKLPLLRGGFTSSLLNRTPGWGNLAEHRKPSQFVHREELAWGEKSGKLPCVKAIVQTRVRGRDVESVTWQDAPTRAKELTAEGWQRSQERG